MAKRLADTDIWKKQWFRKLDPVYKCFVKYLFDNCNFAGIWEVDFEQAEFSIGGTLDNAKSKLPENFIIEFDNGQKWFIWKFVPFQYGNLFLSNKAKPATQKSQIHKKVINALKNQKINSHTLYDTLSHTLYDTVKREREEEEEVKGKVEKEKEAKEEIARPPETEIENELMIWPSFKDFWDCYDKKINKADCQKKWAKLNQGVKEEIMSHLAEYVKATEKQFRKHPETYLNKESWKDEIIKINKNGKSTSAIERHAERSASYAESK